MKIGIFDPYLDDLGGGEKYMMTIAQCLSQNNLVSVFWDNKNDLNKVSERFSLDLSKVVVKKNIFSPNYPTLKRSFESSKYDAIIVLSDGSIPFVLSKKLFIHFQQPFPEVRLSLKTVLKKMRVTSFFCNSYFTKSFIDREFKINSKVLYPPIDTKNKILKKDNTILHVGRFRVVNLGSDDYKKQEVMIDVFKKIIDKGIKNWKFVLAVGLRDEDKERFNTLRRKTKGYPIELLINLSSDKLSEIYSKSKIYWHASGFGENLDRNPELAEHFGISTVEAMGAGCVPVVINAGGQKEIVEDIKSGFLWNSLEDLLKKTINLINDPKLLEKMSKEAVERSKMFNGVKFCNDLINIVER